MVKEKILRWFNVLKGEVAQKLPIPIKALEEMSIMEQVRRLFSELPIEQFKDFRVRDGQGHVVLTVYTTIDDYLLQLDLHTKIITNGGHVLPAMCEFQEKGTAINTFLLSKDGHYQTNLPHTLMLLRSAVMKLCAAVDIARSEQYDTREYNIRLLTPLFNSLRDICLTLSEVAVAKTKA